MRERPDFWTGVERICWLCVLMEHFARVKSLEHAPALLSGMNSITTAPALQSVQLAAHNLRHLALTFTTLQSIKHAVALYNEHHFQHQTSGAYRIDGDTLGFQSVDAFEDPRVQKARAWLSQAVPYERHSAKMADPTLAMAVSLGDDPVVAVRVPISPIMAPLPPRRVHDMDRSQHGGIQVPLADLAIIAHELDANDASRPGRRPGNWSGRFKSFQLLHAEGGVGLRDADAIDLQGTRHLIGLPGAGKTTLLMLLAVWLGRRGLRTMMVFPSIEVARQYQSDLRFHGVRAGMLVGQNPTTRRRHAENIAESIAAVGGQGGFAATIEGADWFAANCVLPAFSSEEYAAWGFGEAPCNRILQGQDRKGRMKERLCPLWTVCGRNKGPRELLDADIWVGHIASMDTRVPEQATDAKVRYFELIARSFDVVVFDEADMVQSYLDSYGAAIMSISGSEASIHKQIQEQIHARFARGENHRLFDRSIELFSRELSEFGNHNTSMISTVHNLDERVLLRFADQLLTTWRVISELLVGFESKPPSRDDATDGEVVEGFTRARALAELWDSSAYQAFYDRTGFDRASWPKSELCSRVLGWEESALVDRRDLLIREFRRYLAEMLIQRRDEIVAAITEHFSSICFKDAPRPRGAGDAIKLLVAVTFMILGYQRILPGTRILVAEGLLREPVAPSTASPELRRFVPENILGSLSGVKFSFADAETTRRGRNVELHYVAFVGAPRMLMHRFGSLLAADGRRGPAVLMASATSFLEASPAFHISVGPDYLLRPRTVKPGGVASSYRFKCIGDRNRGDKPLRYSGAGDLAEYNLLRMVEELVRGGTTRSEVYKAMLTFDVGAGAGRKVALVVNSYAQARTVKRYLDDHHRDVGRRAKAVVAYLREGEKPADYLTSAQVEAVGDDEACDILIFPMTAIGRGVNIVFTKGPRARDAAIGTLYFLTRPHPGKDDMQLLLSLAGRASQVFDERRFGEEVGLKQLHDAWKAARAEARGLARRLLQEPLMASRLGKKLFRPFTANQMVAVLQTIGRGMRNGCPVQVYFVDAAWAPRSAEDKTDDAKTSMLVQMREILEEATAHPDPVARAVYGELYSAFLTPMRAVDRVNFSSESRGPEQDVYAPDGFDDPHHDLE